MHLFCQRSRRIALFLTEIIIYLLAALLRIRIDPDCDEALILCPENGKQTMWSDSFLRLALVKISLIFHSLLAYSLLCRLGDNATCPEDLAECLAY